MATYFFFCPGYNAIDDQEQRGCKRFIDTVVRPGHTYDEQIWVDAWDTRKQAREFHKNLRCGVHNLKPLVYRRKSTHRRKVSEIWRQHWTENYIQGHRAPDGTWMYAHYEVTRRRPAPPTTRSVWLQT